MCELSAVFFFFNLLIALSELIVISEAVVSLLILSGYDDMIQDVNPEYFSCFYEAFCDIVIRF